MTHARLVRVRSARGDYAVHFAPEALRDLPRVTAEAAPGLTGAAMLCDARVEELHGAALRRSLHAIDARGAWIRLPPGEACKDLRTLEHVLRALAQAGFDRGGVLLVAGGGAACDLGGLAAALYHRGVAHVLVPTTLLAQVDAAIGGKTAIDLPEGKNLAGAFHPPRAVLADPDLLRTLPAAEFRSGLGEVLKYAVIAGGRLWERLAAADPEQARAAPATLGDVIQACIALKADLCTRDEFDRGERRLLNLGHTVGHALEAASGFALRHGDAVAVGMIAEARLAHLLGLADAALAASLSDACRRLGLAERAAAGLERVLEHLRQDKKRGAGKITFALPCALGDVRPVMVHDRGPVRDAVASVLAG